MLERLKSLPFGTWFETGAGPAPERGRLKLSWSSPLTNRCLLTNQRGARVDERGLEQLARDLVAGSMRFDDAARDSLLDRCWNDAVAALDAQAADGSGALPA